MSVVSATTQLLFRFQCNEHVEMNKFLCSLACTWITIIDSQFYIIDSLSLDVSLEWNANLVVAWLYKHLDWETTANRSTLFKQLVGYILITCSKTTCVQENQTC